MYSIQTIYSVVEGKFIRQHSDGRIDNLVYDSRRVQQPSTSLFFSLITGQNDGHRYLADAFKKGIRNFIVSHEIENGKLEGSNIIYVKDSLRALQKLAAFHRSQFSIPVIGITGSNGKTIVKEWLFQLLQDDYKIIRSPKSFNSQIGVPLSVWQINEQHTLGIFEAGISKPGEMEKIKPIINPTIGILTNIGEAHDANFSSKAEKLLEKLKLFENTDLIIGSYDLLNQFQSGSQLFTWGENSKATLQILSVQKGKEQTTITAINNHSEINITIPFIDDASIQNAISCWCILLYLKLDPAFISKRFNGLHTVDMRLQLNHSNNGCLVINDSYSADITSLKIALDFLKLQSSGLKRTVILSEFSESGRKDEELYSEIAELLKTYEIKKLILIGDRIIDAMQGKSDTSVSIQNYHSTDSFIKEFKTSSYYNEIILVKGARKFEFERIAQLFEKKLHETVLEINLNALAHNLKEYQKLLNPGTKMMAMVKAFSYGSGGAEIASVLQYHNTDYLGVAYADEGVDLVKAGISLPVMVMNAEESSFQLVVDYNLQPVIYSFDLLHKFESYLNEQGLQSYPVHIEIETGMNRLGFSISEIKKMAEHISAASIFTIQSVFTHLAASEDAEQDNFTMLQADLFQQAIEIIQENISYPFLKHISNSAAIVRHPKLQMDMIRLGIGLYGIETDHDNILDLQTVATLRSTIAQLKLVKKGETVSYNRKGIVNRDSVIATVRIGYADGYSRQFSNGVGKMLVKGILVPVVGNVCMDMTMIDVTDIAGIIEGDDVTVFGPGLPVQLLANWINTIPYELMTGVSQRVKRIYFHE